MPNKTLKKIASITLLEKYEISLVNRRMGKIDHRPVYDISITDTTNNKSVTITDYRPSPFIDTDEEKLNDAMDFISSVASEWHEDHREDGDNFFQDIYNQVTTVMPYSDIEELYDHYRCNEN